MRKNHNTQQQTRDTY